MKRQDIFRFVYAPKLSLLNVYPRTAADGPVKSHDGKSLASTKGAVQAKPLSFDLGSGIKLQLAHCSAGKFTMSNAPGGPDEKGTHEVKITRAYWIAPTRVTRDMSHVLAYIHLNPIRAAITCQFDSYVWSSFTAYAKGDEMAVEGLRFVYDDKMSLSAELKERHAMLMDELLEGIKRERAGEIARKRAAGYKPPPDPLTTEAMIAQAAAHLAEVQSALVELHASRDLAVGTRQKIAESAEQLFTALATNPSADVKTLAEILSCNASYVYKLLSYLQRTGRISRHSRTSPWQLQIPTEK